MRKSPLSDSLLLSAGVIEKVLSGFSLHNQLSTVKDTSRPIVQALTYHAMRYFGWASCISKNFIKHFPNKRFECLLLLNLTLLRKQIGEKEDTANFPFYSQFTIVNQAVHATRNCPKLRPYKNLLNAILRQYLRVKDDLISEVPEAVWNHQNWWIDLLRQAYPKQWCSILEASNSFSPLTLRVNLKKAYQEEVLQMFFRKGFVAKSIGKSAVAILNPKPIDTLPGFHQGFWSVQDFGAQLAVPLLEVKDGMHVLDACAAPGGKTTHFLEIADVNLVSIDIKASRLSYIEQSIKRLGLDFKRVNLKVADAVNLDSWWNGKHFDAVLADVPCTASGIVRRHPEIRWLRKERDVQHAVIKQKSILDSLWETVSPGGRLLYSNCSIFPDEGENQASEFSKKHKDAIRLQAPGQILPVQIEKSDSRKFIKHDGFFYALFTKNN